MNKVIDRLNIRNIQDLYNIQSISENGQIYLKDKHIVIYKIEPANIVACDEETKHKIFQAYISCIRGLPEAFQILISRENISFEQQIQTYKKRLKEIQNEKLKFAIQKYIEYLQEITAVNKLYKTNHYLIVENININEAQEIVNILSNLAEFGVRITQLKQKEQVINVLKKYIMKGI